MKNPAETSLVFEEFEKRILYSADFSPAALAGLADGAHINRQLDSQALPAAEQATAEIAFVAMNLPDAQALIDDLQAQADAGRHIEVVQIAADEDGIARISATLAQRDDITAVHVLSHGSDGVVQLGSARLDAATLLTRAGELAQWSAALSNNADLLLYGCDVAAHSDGQALLANLAALTGADVAASDDLTGAARLGGDWVLEQRTGAIEAQLAPGISEQQLWQGTMALLGQDSFASTGALNGKGGGTGWANNWTSSGSNLQVVSAGLADPSGLLPVSGGSVQLQGVNFFPGATAQRDLSTTLGADGTTTWISFVLRPDGTSPIDYFGIRFGSGGANSGFAGYLGGNFVLEQAGGIGSVIVNGIAPQNGVDVLMVLRLQHAAGSDTMTLYVNPTPGPSSPDSTFTATKSLDLGSFTQIQIAGGSGFTANNAQIDEIRVGQTFADVAPSIGSAPVITSNGAGASANVSAAENQTAVTTVTATDADAGSTLNYSVIGGADAARFAINATTGVLSFLAAPNFEAPTDVGANNVYNVTVQVSDGLLTDAQAIAVTVTNVN